MANSASTSKQSPQIIGSYELHYSTVSIHEGSAVDYAQMRACQLSALSHLIGAEEFTNWNEDIQVNARWLATTLADELASLIPLVAADAAEKVSAA